MSLDNSKLRSNVAMRPVASAVRLAIAGAFSLCTFPAFAQDAPEAVDKGENLDEVIVVGTGSRIVRPGFVAPTPVSAVTAEDLNNTGSTSLGQALQEIPVFRAIQTPATTGLAGSANGSSRLDIRGLGAGRTLVLVNGRRHVSTEISSTSLDTNTLPSIAIDRVEVVTGGASAAYGSDALAGVVNVMYDMDFTGLRVEVQAGGSTESDAQDYRGAFALGSDFDGDRGHFLLAAEFNTNKGITEPRARDWSSRQYWWMPNPDDTGPDDGRPAQILLSGITLRTFTEGGRVIGPAPFSPYSGPSDPRYTFLPGGVLGVVPDGDPILNPDQHVNGGGVTFYDYLALSVPYDRRNLLTAFDYDLTSDIKMSFEAGYSKVTASQSTGYHWDFPLTIQSDNAFIPQEFKTQLDAAAVTSFDIARYSTDMAPNQPETTQEVVRGAIALDGRISDAWSWNAYIQHGETEFRNLQRNNRIQANWFMATDAVVNPANNQIVCRAALNLASIPAPLRSAASRCVPLNVFGSGSPSQAAINYVLGDSFFRVRRKLDVIAAQMQGDLFQLPAGPLTVAFGAEHRIDSLDNSSVDEISAVNGWRVGALLPVEDAELKVNEGFVEVVAPIVKDAKFVELLEFNGAVRSTDYSTSGRVETWKTGLTYSPVSWIRFRGTHSVDIRAPNLGELFGPRGFSTIQPVDPCDATVRATNPRYESNCSAAGIPSDFNSMPTTNFVSTGTGGNPNLDVEEGTTKTFGVVLDEPFDGFRASIDYFDIDIEGSIGSVGAQSILNLCYGLDGVNAACNAVTRGSNQLLVDVQASLQNLGTLKTRGVDFEFDYSFDVASTNIRLRHYGTWLDVLYPQATPDPASRIHLVGSLGGERMGVPDWRWTTSAVVTHGPFQGFLAARYIASGHYDANLTDEDIQNDVGEWWYVDAQFKYDLDVGNDNNIQFFVGVNNILDKDPPAVQWRGSQGYITNGGLYDVVGRYVYGGVRANF